MKPNSELQFVLSQKRREPIPTITASDLTIVEAWLQGRATTQQIRRAKNFSGNNVLYWTALVLKDGFQKGKVLIKK